MRLPALLLVAVLLSCHRPGAGGDGAQVEMKVIPQPPVVGTAEIEIFLRDEKGNPLEATRVEIEGNMTHPGMTPTFGTAEPQGAVTATSRSTRRSARSTASPSTGDQPVSARRATVAS